MKYTILKRFSKIDPFTTKETRYVKFEVLNESTVVRNIKLNVTHVYCALDPDYYHLNKITKYWEPFDDSDYNLKHDFNAYRKNQGLMLPSRIKYFRKKVYGLSQRELAAVLGLGYATVSKIEDNRIIQSVSQDSALRLLLNYGEMISLIKDRLPITNKSSNVNSNVLDVKIKNILKRIKRIEYKKMRKSINVIAELMRDIVLRTSNDDIENPRNFETLIKRRTGVKIIHTDSSKYDGFVKLYNHYGHPEITVSRKDVINRRRFTIAHEIGHLILHDKWLPIPKVKLNKQDNDSPRKALSVMYRGYPGTSSTLTEKQADEFAGDFLMPEKGVRKLYESSNNKNLDDLKFELSSRYHVSTDAAYTRLKNLKNRHLL